MPGCCSHPTPPAGRALHSFRSLLGDLCHFLPLRAQRGGPGLLGWSLTAPGTLLQWRGGCTASQVTAWKGRGWLSPEGDCSHQKSRKAPILDFGLVLPLLHTSVGAGRQPHPAREALAAHATP